MGWAEVDDRGAFYFAHSYAAETPHATGWSEGVVAEARARLVLRLPVPPREERRARRALPRGGVVPLPRLIPCLDVAAGRVVKGVRFKGLRDVGDPVELGAAYSDAGADELVFLDIKATLDDRPTLVELVKRVAERLAIPFTVGGGVRSADDAERCCRPAPTRSRVNSAALARPELIDRARRTARLAGRRRRDRRGRRTGSLARWHAADGSRLPSSGRARRSSGARARSCSPRSTPTGRATGYDLELTASVAGAVGLPVIASGGAGNAGHVADALGIAQAALLASILHENPQRLATLREEVRELGVPVR